MIDFDEITGTEVFKGCSKKETVEFLKKCSLKEEYYKTGDFVAMQDDACSSLYLLTEGNIIAKMTNEEMVAMTVLEKICAELECDISDIMEFTDLAEVKKKIHNDNISPDNGTVNMR